MFFEPYKIISAFELSALASEVNSFLKKHPSYKPIGGISESKGIYYQVLYIENL